MDGQPIAIPCEDGFVLHGHAWPGRGGTVIVNCATGVLARYYHRYAQFLADQGFAVLTYDYRGIGASRPPRLRGCGIGWRDWGALDFEAAVTWARRRDPGGRLAVVGHSIGGFLLGFAASAIHLDRILTVGAQYAYWPDYDPAARARLVLKWHMAMPALTALCGYFPGRRLGWLEDLPAGVAWEWSFRGARMEASYQAAERPAILAGFAAVQAPILAVSMTDDEFATPQAMRRALAYYSGSERRLALLRPAELGFAEVGHFGLFHARHQDGFWPATIQWLRDGIDPWAAPILPPGRAA